MKHLVGTAFLLTCFVLGLSLGHITMRVTQADTRAICNEIPNNTDLNWRSVTVSKYDLLSGVELIDDASDLEFHSVIPMVDQPGCYTILYRAEENT